MNKKKFLVVFVVLMCLICFGVVGCGENETPEDIAYKEAVEKVKMNLKAPTSAKFGSIDNTVINKDYDSNNYYVWGYVDAKNPMGVELRTEYIVKVEIEDSVCKSSEIIKLE